MGVCARVHVYGCVCMCHSKLREGLQYWLNCLQSSLVFQQRESEYWSLCAVCMAAADWHCPQSPTYFSPYLSLLNIMLFLAMTKSGWGLKSCWNTCCIVVDFTRAWEQNRCFVIVGRSLGNPIFWVTWRFCCLRYFEHHIVVHATKAVTKGAIYKLYGLCCFLALLKICMSVLSLHGGST